MRKKHMGWVHRGNYGHQHRVVDMAVIDAIAERVVSKGLAEMDAAERPAVPEWFTSQERTEMQKADMYHKATCPNCGHSDDVEKFTALRKQEEFNDTITKGFNAIMKQHEGERGRFDHMERDRKLSALHRAEMQTKAKMGLL